MHGRVRQWALTPHDRRSQAGQVAYFVPTIPLSLPLSLPPLLPSSLFFETGFHCGALTVLELTLLPPECWDKKCALPQRALPRSLVASAVLHTQYRAMGAVPGLNYPSPQLAIPQTQPVSLYGTQTKD